MVSLGSGGRTRALCHVKTVHWLSIELATAGKVACIAHKTREPCAGEKIPVQRHDNIGLIKLVNGIVVGA